MTCLIDTEAWWFDRPKEAAWDILIDKPYSPGTANISDGDYPMQLLRMTIHGQRVDYEKLALATSVWGNRSDPWLLSSRGAPHQKYPYIDMKFGVIGRQTLVGCAEPLFSSDIIRGTGNVLLQAMRVPYINNKFDLDLLKDWEGILPVITKYKQPRIDIVKLRAEL